jgi:hypothetical protein
MASIKQFARIQKQKGMEPVESGGAEEDFLDADNDFGASGGCGAANLVGSGSDDSHRDCQLVGGVSVRLVLNFVDFRLPFAHTAREVLALNLSAGRHANGNHQAPETGV